MAAKMFEVWLLWRGISQGKPTLYRLKHRWVQLFLSFDKIYAFFFFWNDLLLEYIETLVWLVSSCLHVAHSAREVEQRMKTTGDESVSPVTILPPPGIPLGFDFFPPYLVGYSPPPAKKKGTIPCPRTPIYFNYVCMWNKTGGNIGRYAQKKRIFNRNEYFQYKIKAIAKNQTFFKAN